MIPAITITVIGFIFCFLNKTRATINMATEPNFKFAKFTVSPKKQLTIINSPETAISDTTAGRIYFKIF